MTKRIIQINLNRSPRAQDLLSQTMLDLDCGLACVSEPHRVPNDPRWARSSEQTPMAAVTWSGRTPPETVSVVTQGEGFVAVSWEGLIVVSCYFSPNKSINQFRMFLVALGDAVADYTNKALLVVGDFNARSHIWDNTRPTSRGETILTWASTRDLRLLNNNLVPTCVRPQGRSVVDLSWASPAALSMVKSWEVMAEAETLSDHRYILMQIGGQKPWERGTELSSFPKWNRKSLNADRLQASIATYFWPRQTENTSAEDLAAQLQDAMSLASDAAMRRFKSKGKKAVYW
ncbi:PREDICTED: uncharacterized protein LOC105458440 [Wasmannia auropunctata]|uniref:uncharacterized protein LOC105458440 n=1 Tax=Wasmannia auropunctata TaxID=64793 RepID=UPI0005EDD58F|nr:PREDICTED: uncharacterized protein LOC105458440 [Wasmannia auropunctata]